MAARSSDPPHKHEASDRRDFYRIRDHIGLEIRCHDKHGQSSDLFDDQHLETLRSEFRRLDQDVRSQLVTLSERDRLLASLIKSLNGKLDTLARIMAFEQNPLQPEDWQDVTLSEGGLAFNAAPDKYVVGDNLSMRLTLPPELFQPIADAIVVFVEPTEQGDARVHTEFTEIQDSDRQMIAKHVMRWQVRQRQND